MKFICFFILFEFIFLSVRGEVKKTPGTLEDSLRSVLQTTSSVKDQLEIYNRLAKMNRQQPGEPFYQRKIVELAFQSGADAALYAALANLTRYYYNQQDRDSLTWWVNYVDSVAEVRKESPDALFDAHSFICQIELWDGNYEIAMNEAVRLYNQAKESGSDYALVCCNENLGLIYQEIQRDSDAVVAFEEGLEKLREMGNTPTYEMQFMANLAESYIRTGQLEKVETLLDRYKKMLKEREEENKKLGLAFPVKRCRCLMYVFYTHLYIQKGELPEAFESLRRAGRLETDLKDEYIKSSYRYAAALYYHTIKHFPQALTEVDLALDNSYDLRMLELKLDILQDMGRFKEGLALSREILMKTNEINNEAFTRQINQLRTLHDLNNKEVQAYQLRLSEQKLNSQHQRLVVSLIVSLILFILLYILFLYYRVARRYQKELMKEKEEAERANRMKSAFIANISHEIRTPLNAIVGFSELISDESAGPEEKKEFSTLISNNSNLLLNLVNDVLDLSRMESGSMKFTIAPADLATCCRNALSSVEHRVKDGVKLIFTPSEDPFLLHTDSLRLQQLLINLLTNAAKFTENGHILLSYEVEKEHKQVRIMVTDTGCGIPADKRDLIFERFEKVNEYVQGSGLGLSICKIIAARLNGSVFLDAGYTGGARFVFIHPCDQPVFS